MCGIAGLIANKKYSEAEIIELTSKMAQTLSHRGPDDSGLWSQGSARIALAHRRLSIQDTSSHGKQPMSSSNGRYVISYNGEIYNFHNIANNLRKKGIQFQGNSDTEVILAAIQKWGVTDALKQFAGMFAFALWDRDTKKLYFARDRLGEKPLYFGVLNGNFVFTSELKSLSNQSEWKLDICRNSLSQYMRYGYVPTPYSIYKGIYKASPGMLYEINVALFNKKTQSEIEDIENLPDFIQTSQYWKLESIVQSSLSSQITSEKDAINQLDTLLHNTIKQQMISDVPIGAFLSGGIDSSTVVSIMQSEAEKPINTYTIGFSEKQYNEAKFAKEIAAHLGTAHTELYVTPDDALNVVPDLPTIYDEPFADSSQIPTYLVSKLARNSVTVCLSGDGGDELFAGYNRYIWTEQVWSKFKLFPVSIRKIIANIIESVPPSQWDFVYQVISKLSTSKNQQKAVGIKLHKLAQLLKSNNLTNVYLNLISYWHSPTNLVLNSTEPLSVIRDNNFPANASNFIDKAMYWDLLSYLPDDNLVKVDRASMAVSLETRLPLLNHNIVEFAWQVPLAMKVKNSTSKHLLREVLYRYVPKNLIERPKMGFSVPIGEWLRGPLRDWAESLLDKRKLAEQGYLNTTLVHNRWNEHISGKRNWQLSLWAVLMFQAWYTNENSKS